MGVGPDSFDPLARWRELMGLPEEDLPLDEAALVISAAANPDLDVAAQLDRLDALAGEVVPGETDALLGHLFGTLGLAGDRESYDDPANSYLDRVLDRRRGIPISLSVLVVEVGRRLGLPLEGVGMPGHFLVRDRAAADRLIDPFFGGRRLDHAGCEELLRAAAGPGARLTPGMLAATGTRAVLSRMLNNLDHSFRRRADHPGLSWVTRLRMAVPGVGLGTRAELAALLAELGYPGEAAAAYEELARTPGLDPEVAGRLAERAVAAGALLN